MLGMEITLRRIIDKLKSGESLDEKGLDVLVRKRNREMHDGKRNVAKRRLMSFYLHERNNDTALWNSWDVDAETDKALMQLLKAKPRRTASGVATITVLTKPWPCASDCIYCPNDIRMPKSYMSDEPACQRAERNYFDPYLQVASRLRVLADMGHTTDKIELIVLGGTWSDYPKPYRTWFVTELLRALNDASDPSVLQSKCERTRMIYERCTFLSDPDDLRDSVWGIQQQIDRHALTYNDAFHKLTTSSDHPLYFDAQDFREMRAIELFNDPADATEALVAEQTRNENAEHRNVGMVFETRPDKVDLEELVFLRSLGCTKVQMGIQSLDDDILTENCRNISTERIAEAFVLLRAFGFKTHIHFMTNLLGATPAFDKDQYEKLVTDTRFIPDEIKLYPCALVKSSVLMERYLEGSWSPYTEEELLDVLTYAISITPPYMRISRMIRDISAKDIVVGNKKTNLRQLVEQAAYSTYPDLQEMRIREIATEDIDEAAARIEIISYPTDATKEYFLQWVTPENKLIGFCRLSLPTEELDCEQAATLEEVDLGCGRAMIREVHVYGKVSKLHEADEGAQHIGFGKRLVERACALAKEHGCVRIHVISALGTKKYYRSLGFTDHGLYQSKLL